MPKVIAVITIVVVVAFALVAFLPQDKEVKPTFVGKRYVPIENKPVLNIISDEGWLNTSEYAGKEVGFGIRKFFSGKAYKVPEIGIEETEDPWNYVNGDWFTWVSADGQKYSVRITNGYTTGFKMNNIWKNVDLMYTPTFGLGLTRLIELFILNGILNTEIMPFVSEASRQIKYFSVETKPNDYYMTKDRITVNPKSDPAVLRVPKEVISSEVVIEKKPVFYGTKIGETAPLFDMLMLDGRKVNLSEFYGRKTVLNIWATWCRICITEFPVINEAYVQNKGANILAVCSDGTPKQIQRIKDKYSTKYPCDFTMTSAIGIEKIYGLKGFPTTYFLDECGIIRYVKIGGFDNPQQVESILNSY